MTDVIFRSCPVRTEMSGLPHGQSRIGPSGSNSLPHIRHLQRPAGSVISRRAPCRSVPSVTRSKQNRTESATTPDSAPISSRTQVIRAPGSRPVTASMTSSVIASSCTILLSLGSADTRQRVADQQVDDSGPAEGGLQQYDAGRVIGDVPDDRGL